MIKRVPLLFLRRLLALEDTPKRVALGLSVGVFLAFSPFMGLQTFLGLIVAFLFGLNRMAVLMGVFLNNPWTLVPIYAAGVYLGGLVVGRHPSEISLPAFSWSQLWQRTFWMQLAGQWPVFKPLLVGSLILSFTAAILSYPFALLILVKGRSRYSPQA
jgi:uncharacterized protein (DUF2062 family)